ncbi:hypothetical protein A2U01_0114922, partial [Trifolium medium]|nr:hypothetical protein [Trifolium medium]
MFCAGSLGVQISRRMRLSSRSRRADLELLLA